MSLLPTIYFVTLTKSTLVFYDFWRSVSMEETFPEKIINFHANKAGSFHLPSLFAGLPKSIGILLFCLHL